MRKSNIADLGSLNINGSVKDIIPSATGFDICSGKGVDVVLEPAVVPEKYMSSFDIVFCVNALNACPDVKIFVKEIKNLLKSGGILFLAFRLGNYLSHSTSPNKYGYGWYQISDPDKIICEFSSDFDIVSQKCIITSNDYLVIMKKKIGVNL